MDKLVFGFAKVQQQRACDPIQLSILDFYNFLQICSSRGHRLLDKESLVLRSNRRVEQYHQLLPNLPHQPLVRPLLHVNPLRVVQLGALRLAPHNPIVIRLQANKLTVKETTSFVIWASLGEGCLAVGVGKMMGWFSYNWLIYGMGLMDLVIFGLARWNARVMGEVRDDMDRAAEDFLLDKDKGKGGDIY